MSTEPRYEFEYLLNAMEHAAQSDAPAKEGYADKRRAVLAHVADLTRQLKLVRTLAADLRETEHAADQLSSDIRATRAAMLRTEES